ncbi:hypothetical protein [Sorangium sp. So ce1153]|uniref:hypothetical protein n=1 Tax=Sorangium sp. So ce1153 TaxID=3133333 RepID=UPI003F5E2D49
MKAFRAACVAGRDNREMNPAICVFCGMTGPADGFFFGPCEQICFECLAVCHLVASDEPRYREVLEKVVRQRELASQEAEWARQAGCGSCGEPPGMSHNELVACASCVMALAREVSNDPERWCRVLPSASRSVGEEADEVDAEVRADLALAYLEMECLDDALHEAIAALTGLEPQRAVPVAGRVLLRLLSPRGRWQFRMKRGRWAPS